MMGQRGRRQPELFVARFLKDLSPEDHPLVRVDKAHQPPLADHVHRTCATEQMNSDQWYIEAVFYRLKDFRHVATRHDKLARNYASTLAIATMVE